jgi:hypothetical protein
VLAQHVELALDVVAGEQVARLCVLGDQPQRLPLAPAADEDRRRSGWGELSVRSSR